MYFLVLIIFFSWSLQERQWEEKQFSAYSHLNQIYFIPFLLWEQSPDLQHRRPGRKQLHLIKMPVGFIETFKIIIELIAFPFSWQRQQILIACTTFQVLWICCLTKYVKKKKFNKCLRWGSNFELWCMWWKSFHMNQLYFPQINYFFSSLFRKLTYIVMVETENT